MAEQRGEKLRHALVAWENVDVDDGERVRSYVDDDVHAKQGHAELSSELLDEGGHSI